VIARAEGVERVLVTCNETNAGSRRVIEHCGGVFESLVFLDPEQRLGDDDGNGVRRYWFE
jgi:predicted acetyltransferase